MLVSEKIAIAAHLHVVLRRKTGRVTDTEWMAQNLDYALEIVRFARARAKEDGHADLAEWADKLERAVLTPAPAAHRPLVQTAAQLLAQRHAAPAAAAATQPARQPAPQPEPAASDFGASTFAPSTGFRESTLNGHRPRKPKDDPDTPRYVGGIR